MSGIVGFVFIITMIGSLAGVADQSKFVQKLAVSLHVCAKRAAQIAQQIGRKWRRLL